MEPLHQDDRLEYAIRHPKLFSADAREGRSRRLVSIILWLMGALFVMAFGVWFASIRETKAESAAQLVDVRPHVQPPATMSTVYLNEQRRQLPQERLAAEDFRGHIYKCLGKSGSTTFQQFPCPAGAKTDKVIAYVPRYEPVRSPSFPAIPSQSPQYAMAVTPSAGTSPQASCRAAEVWADDQRRQLGIHATFANLSVLQDYVYEHCKTR